MITLTKINGTIKIEGERTDFVTSQNGDFEIRDDSFFIQDKIANKEYWLGPYTNVSGFVSAQALEDYLTSFFSIDQSGGSASVGLNDENGDHYNVQNPQTNNSDSVYISDIDIDNSDNGDFSGSVTDLFDNLKTVNISPAGTNPRTLKIWFNRTVYSHTIGLGCDDLSKGFGTDVTVKLLGSGEAIRYTKNFTGINKNSALLEFGKRAFNGFILEFNTTDEICLSNVTIQKAFEGNVTIHGEKPDGSVGTANLSGFNNLKVAVSEIVSDAFGRQKVSLPTSLLDSVIEHDMNNIFVDYLTNGAGSVNFDGVNNVVDMSVTNTGDYAIIETIANGKYQPGKALEFVASTLMTSQANVIKRCGYCTVRFHAHTATNEIQNGIYFENNEGQISWNIVKNAVVTEQVFQSNWNIDKLDGTGASLFNLDTDFVQLPYIDLQFLAVGTVRVGFNINGQDVIVHKFYHANTPNFTSTYMHTANLPVHYSITSKGSAGAMKAIGYSVASGGGFDALGKLGFVFVDDITIPSGDTELLVGIRLKDDFYNAFVKLLSAEVITTGGSNFRWMILMNPTYTNTVTWIDESNSSVQSAINNNNEIIDYGIKIAGGLASDRTRSSKGDLDNSLRLGKRLDGSFIEIWLAAYAITGDDFHGVLNYKDLF